MADPPWTAPSWTAPFDAEAYIQSIPSETRVRGLFFRNLIKQLRDARADAPTTSYVPFEFYPGAEYNRLLVACARTCHPDVPLRQGLRRVGHTVYGTFLGSTIGRVLFAFAGRDPRAALRVAPRAYDVASGGSIKAKVMNDGPHRTILEIDNIWSFPVCHELGVLEGALKAFGGAANAAEAEPKRSTRSRGRRRESSVAAGAKGSMDKAFGSGRTIEVRERSPCDVDFRFTWD